MPTPIEAAKLDQLRKLKGGARVAYPYSNDERHVVVERVVGGLPREKRLIAWLTADKEHTGALLVVQQELGGDATGVEVYRKYETLPGPKVWRYWEDDSGATILASYTQRVRADEVSEEFLELLAEETEVTLGDGTDIEGTIIDLSVTEESKAVSVVTATFSTDLVKDAEGQSRTRYKVDYPYEERKYPRVTWTITIPEEVHGQRPWSQRCLVRGYRSLHLTHEEFQIGPKSATGSLTLVYETLPGPWLWTPETMERERVNLWTGQIKLRHKPGSLLDKVDAAGTGTTLRTMQARVDDGPDNAHWWDSGTPPPGRLRVTARVLAVDAKGNREWIFIHSRKLIEQEKQTCTLIVQGSVVPPVNYELVDVGFQFPAVLTLVGTSPFGFVPLHSTGWPGVDFSLQSARQATFPALAVRYYIQSETKPDVPEAWSVTTRAASSRFFPVNNNTIHPAWTATLVNGDAETTYTEIFAASTPATYSSADVLLTKAVATKWRGNIWEIMHVYVCEDGVPSLMAFFREQYNIGRFRGINPS